MAEKAEKKPDAAPAPAGGEHKEGAKGGMGALLGKTPVILGVVMVLEAVVLFAGFKMLGGGPAPAEGAELTDPHDPHATGDHGEGGAHGAGLDVAEVLVLQFKAPNKMTGRTFLYDVAIYIVVPADQQEKVAETIKAREALIQDRVRTIIAQSDPEKLGGGSEPGLETLRRQVKYQLDEIVGDGLINEVLIPKCIPIRADY